MRRVLRQRDSLDGEQWPRLRQLRLAPEPKVQSEQFLDQEVILPEELLRQGSGIRGSDMLQRRVRVVRERFLLEVRKLVLGQLPVLLRRVHGK